MAQFSGAATGGLTAAQDAKLTAIPTTAMRGTDSAALAAVLGALADGAGTGAITADRTAMTYIKQLVTTLNLVPTTAMRGTDGAALASVVGALDTAAATGAVTGTDLMMAYVKQLVTELATVAADADHSEEHVHNRVVWYGKNADQTTIWCNAESMTGFVATSGDNAWGTAGTDPAKCFNVTDVLTELGTGLVCADFDKILITANTSNTMYRGRVVWGTVAQSVTDAITALQYTDFLYTRTNTDTTRIARDIKMPRLTMDNWVRVVIWNATDDATLTFFFGVHAYDF
jgi:hypothetical protein